MRREREQKTSKKRLRIYLAAALLAVLAALCCAYARVCYRADAQALDALAPDAAAQVEKTDFGWLFDGPGSEAALIFYPGAGVEASAYAPLLHRVAAGGVDVFLVNMPLRFAILGVNRAEPIRAQYPYSSWYIGGHSLGGVAAARYASEHGDALDGIVFCASYPANALPDTLRAVVVYGSNDRVLNRERFEQSRPLWPRDTVEHVIEGGNHAQFGSYGAQRGDGAADITAQVQWDEAAGRILSAILS